MLIVLSTFNILKRNKSSNNRMPQNIFRFLLFAFCFSPLKAQKVSFQNPEVYELIHVAFALTDFAQESANLTDTASVYFKEIQQRFGEFRQHPHLQYLDKKIREDYTFYTNLRVIAAGYTFEGENIEALPQFGWEREVNYYFAFGRHRHRWAAFAKTIGFRAFYAEKQNLYQEVLARAQRELAISEIQTWLEANFPNQYDGYEIFISPLEYASHQTFNYENEGKKYCRMFISPSSSLPFFGNRTRNEGIYNGAVFTEIDHNYVNPVSDHYSGQIRRVFRDRAQWVNENGTDVRYYESPQKVFNEYMTHAIYVLWVYEKYEQTHANFIAERRFRMMERRGYKMFRRFYQVLQDLYQQRNNKNISELYPALLDQLPNLGN